MINKYLILGLLFLFSKKAYSQNFIRIFPLQESGLSVYDETIVFDDKFIDKLMKDSVDINLLVRFMSKKSFNIFNKILVENYENNKDVIYDDYKVKILFYNSTLKKYCSMYLPYDDENKSFFNELKTFEENCLKPNNEIINYFDSFDSSFILELYR